MNKMIAQWEDEENNRQVQFSVDYTVENSRIEITNVTPNKVSFVCPSSNTCVRSIGVHTDRGRNLLSRQLENAGQIVRLLGEIESRSGNLVTV